MMVAAGLGGIAEILPNNQQYTASFLRLTVIALLLYFLVAVTFAPNFFDFWL